MKMIMNNEHAHDNDHDRYRDDKDDNYDNHHDYHYQVGGYLADILDKAESDFVKSVLNVVNPKVNHIIITIIVVIL